jgi:hypothetical protein
MRQSHRVCRMRRRAVGFVRVFDSIRVFDCVLQQSHSERRPTGLMACAKTTAGFAMEVFAEQNQITPVRVDTAPSRTGIETSPTAKNR